MAAARLPWLRIEKAYRFATRLAAVRMGGTLEIWPLVEPTPSPHGKEPD
jgi:hypothetical protein